MFRSKKKREAQKKYDVLLSLIPYAGTSNDLLDIANGLNFSEDDEEYVEDIINGVWSGFPACCVRSFSIDGRHGMQANKEYEAKHGKSAPPGHFRGYIRCRKCEADGVYTSNRLRSGYIRYTEGKLAFEPDDVKLALDALINDVRLGTHRVRKGLDAFIIQHGDTATFIGKGTYPVFHVNTSEMMEVRGYKIIHGCQGSQGGWHADAIDETSFFYTEYEALYKVCEQVCV
jgi:hypothetical protein